MGALKLSKKKTSFCFISLEKDKTDENEKMVFFKSVN